jgi:REP element-mobilizing transposase RayT
VVIAIHLIFGAYGFWLPNDPRGSWSDFVGSWELLWFGRATKTDVRHSVAAKPHDVQARLAAQRALKYPPVRFDGRQARAVGRGFAEFATGSRLIVWGCSILPEHVHLVVARHRFSADQIANHLKGAATTELIREGIHPLGDRRRADGRLPTPWARGKWAVFLDTPEGVRRAMAYVEANPAKEGLPPQRWRMVRPFDG